jgi:hypothetical protein
MASFSKDIEKPIIMLEEFENSKIILKWKFRKIYLIQYKY